MVLSKTQSLGTDDHNIFTIELRPTTKCNYNCYYCTDLHINSNPVIELNPDDLINLINQIRTNTKLTIHIFICGGEPTMYRNLTHLINCIAPTLHGDDWITIQSNMSKSLEWFKMFVDNINDVSRVKINCSYHNTQQDVNITSYLKKCMFLLSTGVLGVVSFGYNQKKDVLLDYKTALKLLPAEHCEIIPLINSSVDQDPQKGNGSDKDIDYIYKTIDRDELKDYGHFFQPKLQYTDDQNETHYISRGELWLERTNNFHGYECSVSKFKIYVDWDGSCYKCFNEQFSSIKPVMNICEHDNVKDYFKNLKCMNCPFTTCFFDLEYLKTKNNKHVEYVRIDRHFNTQEYRDTRKP